VGQRARLTVEDRQTCGSDAVTDVDDAAIRRAEIPRSRPMGGIQAGTRYRWNPVPMPVPGLMPDEGRI
jgi:hypothetical protein